MKNYSNATRVRFEILKTVAFGSITNAYVAFGTPYADPIRILDIFNDTDAPIVISFDGTNNNIYCPAHSGRIYDYAANKQSNADQLEQAKFTQAYIKYFAGAPSVGSVFLGSIYASND